MAFVADTVSAVMIVSAVVVSVVMMVSGVVVSAVLEMVSFVVLVVALSEQSAEPINSIKR